MVKYSQGKIYKITGGGLTYIGSTTQTLSQRLADHIIQKKMYAGGLKSKRMSSFQVLDSPDYAITLVEDVNCERKEQLLQRERHWIENTHCVNKVVPLRTEKERYQIDKDRINEKRRERYKKSKDIVNAETQLPESQPAISN
jgi:hypothetical protein